MNASCNMCSCVIDGMAYRTSCLHLLCIQCATEAFTSGISCPTCGNILSRNDVSSIALGHGKQMHISSTLFELNTCENTWTSITANIGETIDALKDLVSLVNYQLCLEVEKLHASASQLQQETQTFKSSMIKLNDDQSKHISKIEKRILENEESLLAKDNELNEIKIAYKEKLRKCQAWEKAYNTLKSQVVGSSKLDQDKQEVMIQSTNIAKIEQDRMMRSDNTIKEPINQAAQFNPLQRSPTYLRETTVRQGYQSTNRGLFQHRNDRTQTTTIDRSKQMIAIAQGQRVDTRPGHQSKSNFFFDNS